MRTPIWIGPRPCLVCAAFKKDLPITKPWQTGIRIAFRFETVWCIRIGHSLLEVGGALLPITEVYLRDRVLIGRDDAYQAGLDYSEDAKTFRNALNEREKEVAP